MNDDVLYNGIVINNWLEYLRIKFSDKNYFELIEELDKNMVTVKSKTNKVKIWFYSLADEYKFISNCHYASDDCYGWSSELLDIHPDTNGAFSQESLDFIDKLLEVPIYEGWISHDYSLLDFHYKSKTYSVKDPSETPFTYVSSRFGCLTILFFPIFILIDILFKCKLIGTIKVTNVDPLIKSVDSK